MVYVKYKTWMYLEIMIYDLWQGRSEKKIYFFKKNIIMEFAREDEDTHINTHTQTHTHTHSSTHNTHAHSYTHT